MEAILFVVFVHCFQVLTPCVGLWITIDSILNGGKSVTVMNNFCCMMCKAALTGPRKCSPTSLGVFFQNIFEKKKD